MNNSINQEKRFIWKYDKIQFLFIYLILRLPLLIIRFDLDEFAAMAHWIIIHNEEGLSIYEIHRTYDPGKMYLPLFYYFADFIIFYLGGTYLSLKLFWFSFDILNFIYIYKIGNEIFDSNKKKRDLLLLIYLLCPFVFILTSLRGLGEVITLFFILSSFYYFIRKKFVLSMIFLSLGILYGLIPALLIIPYFLYLLNYKNELKKVIPLFVVIFISIFGLLALPFFLTYGSEYIEDLISILFRRDYSIGIYKEIPDYTLFSLQLLNYEIEISLFNIIQFIVIIFSIFIFSWKYKVDTNEKLIMNISYFLLLVPILTRSFHFRLMFWLFPFLLFMLLLIQQVSVNRTNFKSIKKNIYSQVIIFAIGNISILIIFLLFMSEKPNFEFSRTSFYIILIVYCIFWGFCLLFLNLLKLLILEIFILYYCFYLIFFIVFGYVGLYIFIFFPIYCVLCVLMILYIFKIWNDFRSENEI